MKKIKTLTLNQKRIDFVLLDLRDSSEMETYNDLFEDCYGKRSNISHETLKWFNFQNPMHDNLLFAFMDVESNKMISSYGFLPGDVFVDGEMMKYLLANNVMTHPQYSGQGIFKRMGAEAFAFLKMVGYSFIFGVPNYAKGHVSSGWEIVNELKFYESRFTEKPKLSFSQGEFKNNISQIRDWSYLDLYVNKYSLFFNRTSRWMDWRINKPHSDYLAYCSEEENAISFVVLKKFRDEKTQEKRLHIVDFGYNNLESFKKLILYSKEIGWNEGVDLINLWQYPSNKPEVQVLESLGFLETTTSNPIIIHKLENDIALPPDSWHVTLFDNDVF